MTIGLVAYAQEPSDYYIKYGADVTENHDSHYPIMVDVSNVCGEQQILNNIASTVDATLKVSGIASGDELYDYPINDYVEPRVGTAPDAASWGTLPDGLIATWDLAMYTTSFMRFLNIPNRMSQLFMHGRVSELTYRLYSTVRQTKVYSLCV